MNKDIVLPSRRLLVSSDPQRSVVAKITTLTERSQVLWVHDFDMLPLARALIEIYEGIEAEKEKAEEEGNE